MCFSVQLNWVKYLTRPLRNIQVSGDSGLQSAKASMVSFPEGGHKQNAS